jgi:release factor glutamine methyltransferase
VPTTWRDLQAGTAEQLARAGVARADVEARWIVEEASGRARAELVAVAREPTPARVTSAVSAMVERRVGGEPLQYVLGSWAFGELDLFVDRRVLIPRPETEVVAEVAVDEAVRLGARRGEGDRRAARATPFAVADLGTGSGALALALAAALPDAVVWATDKSVDALAVARANLSGAGATRVRLACGSWYSALPAELVGALRLVVSNPPYVAAYEVGELPREVADYEPLDALVSGPTGLEAIDEIVRGAPEWLEPRGTLVCELASHRAAEAAKLAAKAGFAEILVRPDRSGRDRVLVARRGTIA